MQPYLESISSQALRIRWISVQCYEMVLPCGKVLVTGTDMVGNYCTSMIERT